MKQYFAAFVVLTLLILDINSVCLAQESARRLTLREAIAEGLRANLGLLVARSRVDEAEGTRVRRQSAAFLPRFRAGTLINYQALNFRASGLTFPGIPAVVGPFTNYDFRLFMEQNIFDLQTYRGLKASEYALEAAKMDYQDSRDLIIRTIAGFYLDAQSAAARVDAAQSRRTVSEALFQLAKSKHDAGTATGVDLLRSQVKLANDKQALLVAQNQYKQALLVLARNIGISPGSPLEVAETLRFQPLPIPQADDVVSSALQSRADYISLSRQRQELVEQQRASKARYYPKISMSGNYGAIGGSTSPIQGTGIIQGQADFTVFDRDRTGEAKELAGRIQRIDDEIADLRRGIEQDVHQALLNLESTSEQVPVAREGQDLAQKELDLTQERFRAGVTNNIEVTTAQDELARAQENYILAVSSYIDAKFALARAAGDIEKNIGRYLENPAGSEP